MIHKEIKDLPRKEIYSYLTGGIGPRPIALVSTLNKEGRLNLAPFSFFNVFSITPPMVAFSPVRRGRDGSLKDTYYNLIDTKECVIQAVPFDIVEQVNTCSIEFDNSINEFEKSGLTPIPSDIVKAFRVKESPFQMECRLHEVVSFGDEGGAGNLMICEVLKFHLEENILGEDGIILDKLDLVGRNNGESYTRSNKSSIFEVPRAVQSDCVGYENLPTAFKESKVLSANNLARLANSLKMPNESEVNQFIIDIDYHLNFRESTIEESMIKYTQAGDYIAVLKIALLLLERKDKRSSDCFEIAGKCALEIGCIRESWLILLYWVLNFR